MFIVLDKSLDCVPLCDEDTGETLYFSSYDTALAMAEECQDPVIVDLGESAPRTLMPLELLPLEVREAIQSHQRDNGFDIIVG